MKMVNLACVQKNDDVCDGAQRRADDDTPNTAPRRHRRRTSTGRAGESKRQLRKLCIDAAPAALERLIATATDPLSPDAIAFPKCREILEYAFGPMRELEPMKVKPPVELDLPACARIRNRIRWSGS